MCLVTLGAFVVLSPLSAEAGPTAKTVVTTFPQGVGQQGVAVSPDGTTVWLTIPDDNEVFVLSASSGAQLAHIVVGSDPFDVVFNASGSTAWVSNAQGGNVSVIDVATLSVTSTITVGTNPEGMALSPDGTSLWVANENRPGATGTISVIDTGTETVSRTISVGVGADPCDIVLSPDGQTAWVAQYGDSNVIAIATSSGTIVQTIGAVGSGPRGMVISPDGSSLWVAARDGTVVRIDTTADAVVETYPVGGEPSNLAISPDGTRIWATNEMNGPGSVPMWQINTVHHAITATIELSAPQYAAAVSPDSNSVWVAGNGTDAYRIQFAPKIPRSVEASAGNGQATVSWTAPESEGSSPVTSYTATAEPGGESCTTSELTCVIAGLTNGTSYSITVTATNAEGTSDPSVAVGVVPSALADTGSNTSALVDLALAFLAAGSTLGVLRRRARHTS